jgi:dTDP-4-dehydrorhamnose 3,5-epimerase
VKVQTTPLPGVLIITPRLFGDQRGFFVETYQQQRYREAGIDVNFVQDNLSRSTKGTLRGLHFQHPRGQAKLVQAVQGEIFDVAVDIRRGSPTFGQWFGTTLSDSDQRQLFIPSGFAHGFCVLSQTALFSYKCSDYYTPGNEGGLRWDDPDVAIGWGEKSPLLSERDRALPLLMAIGPERLPQYEAAP